MLAVGYIPEQRTSEDMTGATRDNVRIRQDSGPSVSRPGRMQGRLDTWKEIGGFLGRDERTAKRWEVARGLPVHRIPGGGRSQVYAFAEELTAWLRGADPETLESETLESETFEPEPPGSAADPHPFNAQVIEADSAAPPDADILAAPSRARRGRGRNIGRLAAVAVLASALTVAVWWVAASRPKLPPGRTGVVLADVQNFTGEADFDHVVDQVLRIDLDQSPFLQVVSDVKAAETLALMEQPSGTPLSLTTARSICLRTDGGAVIAPMITRIRNSYVLTLSAYDCISGRTLVDEKAESDVKERLPVLLDGLAARMRGRLGELQSSISRFDVPSAPERTRSFEALRAFSEAEWLARRGKRMEAVPLYRHAIELDPDFAMAYFGLALNYYGLGQVSEEAAAIAEAHNRVKLVSERSVLLIEHLYNMAVTRDLDAASEKMELMTQLYPKDASAWMNLSDTRFRLADYQGAVAAGEESVKLDPKLYFTYTALSRALNHLQQTARAEQVDDAALKQLPENGMIRQQRIGWRFLQGDAEGGRRLVASAIGTPMEREALLEDYNFTFAEGRLREAARLMARAEALGRGKGMQPNFTEQASNYADLGLVKQARAFLAAVPAERWSGEDDYIAARVEDPATAQADLDRDLARWPHDTALNGEYALQARAALLLRQGHALEAARLLDGVGRLTFRDLDTLFLQATAFLAAGDGPAAAAGYRAILAQTGFGWQVNYPLSHLGLARALHLQGDLAGSRREYQAFLAAWSGADADVPALQQARAEYATLVRSKASG